MSISIYVDGSGGSKSGYGYYVKNTGESYYEEKANITNNQAEYLAIITALKKFANSKEDVVIYSDSKNTVNQLNHEYAINDEKLQKLAREAWPLIAQHPNVKIEWIPREKNLAGKMLGS